MEFAARQHGIVSRRQLLQAGISSDVIDRYIHIGRLRRLHRGTFQAGPVMAPRAHVMAAVLAVGEGAVASHVSAAALWGIMREGDVVDVTTARRRRSRAGIRVHRAILRLREITSADAVPVTTPIRTLFDLASRIAHRDLERVVAEAVAARLVTESVITDQLGRYRGRGARVLREIVGCGVAPALTRSEAEERFLGLVRRAQIDHPQVNAIVERFEVDFLWRTKGLIVEIDGHRYHASKRSFENDRLRDAKLLAAGYNVMRVTWDQIRDAPEALLVRLVLALERASSQRVGRAASPDRSSERRT